MRTEKILTRTIKVNCRYPISTSDIVLKITNDSNYSDGFYLNLFYNNLIELYKDSESYKSKGLENISKISNYSKIPNFFIDFCSYVQTLKLGSSSRILLLSKMAKEFQSEQVI